MDDSLRQRLGRLQNLFRPRAHPVVFRQHSPTNCPRRIQKEFGRPGDIMTVLTLALVNQVKAANRFQFRIGKKSESVASFLAKIARDFRTIDADRDRTNPYFFEPVQTILNAPQLGVA